MCEEYYLPALKEQASVDCPEPHDRITSLEITQPVAFGVQVHAQTFEQFGRGCLDYSLLWNGLDHLA